MGQEKLLYGHNQMNDGTTQCDFWDRRSQYWVITRQIMGQKKVTFGDRSCWSWVITRRITGQNKMTFWDRRNWNYIISRCILGLNKVSFWDKRSRFWVITRWIMGHDDVTFLGQEKLIFCHDKMNCRTKRGHFLRYWKVILVHIRWWSYGRFQDDNNIFHKMKNDLTTGTWQDNIWCPINIIFFCTSDAVDWNN